jgi:jumonji domain-containing protein 7
MGTVTRSPREDPNERDQSQPTGPEDVTYQQKSYEEDDTSEPVFLQPATTCMTLSKLIDELCAPVPASPSAAQMSPPVKPVYYLQSQDSNLSRPELASLIAHLPATPPPFALPILGDPDATNIWIGNAQSVTSTHRDPYENLYLVVKGRKQFVLYAPVEEICLHATMVRTGRWTFDEDTEKFNITMDVDGDVDEDVDDDHPDDGEAQGEDASPSALDTPSSDETSTSSNTNPAKIPWIPIDPLHPPPPSSALYPYYKHARPLTVTVEEGQILYLPAGWFHHVTQECGRWEDEDEDHDNGTTTTRAPCIALNYWFDMDYSGEKHVMREMVGRLVEKVRRSERSERSEKA